MKVLICGDGQFNQRWFVYRELDRMREKITTLLCTVESEYPLMKAAREWAENRGVPVENLQWISDIHRADFALYFPSTKNGLEESLKSQNIPYRSVF